MATVETPGGQLVEVAGTFDAAGNFIIQDPDGLFAQSQNSSGKSLLKPELTHHIAQQSGPMKVMVRPGSQGTGGQVNRSPFSSAQGNSSVSDARWLQQSTARGGKVLPRKPVSNAASGFRYSGSQLTSGAIMGGNVVSMSSGIGMNDRDSLRMAVATSSRGRPRGRRPLRGQFPVVPIDMVRQLGIEQQVILQPPFPVAMCNKGMLSKPLSMSKKTQCWPNHMDIATQTSGAEITEADALPMKSSSPSKLSTNKETVSNRPIYISMPVPMPVYVPLPMRLFTKMASLPTNITIPYPLPVDLLLDGTEAGEILKKSFLVTAADINEAAEKPLEYEESYPDLVSQMLVSESIQECEEAPSRKRSAPETLLSRKDDLTGAPEAKRPCPTPAASVVSDVAFRLKFSYGINAWRHWVNQKITANEPGSSSLKAELLEMNSKDLAESLARFVVEVRKPNNECYVADSIFYLCLGIQEYLNENGREESLFGEPMYAPFTEALDNVLASFMPRISPDGLLICRIEEEHLWEAKQLGQQTPQILLFTVLYFNTKNKCLSQVESHASLSFATFSDDDHKSRVNEEEPFKCPVQMMEAYMLRCPQEVSDSNYFYFTPIENWRDSDIWFSDKPLNNQEITIMFNRVKLVKEIQEVMHNQGESSYN